MRGWGGLGMIDDDWGGGVGQGAGRGAGMRGAGRGAGRGADGGAEDSGSGAAALRTLILQTHNATISD